MQLLRNILIVAAAFGILLVWHDHGAAIKSSLESSGPGSLASDTAVVTYSTSEELIGKLRHVKAGQRLDLEFVGGPPKLVSSGIRFSDVVAAAAFREQGEREAREQTQAISAEQAHIQGTPQ